LSAVGFAALDCFEFGFAADAAAASAYLYIRTAALPHS
jgi:hypothetical protein